MNTAILALTKGGFSLAEKLKQKFPEAKIHARENIGNADEIITGNFTEYIGRIFNEYDSLIFIMACGIVVRSIAPFIKNKTVDPAVLVMDEKGKFVISLLSGHLGGANALATEIAEKTGAQPVITTSSDVNGLVSVDMIAQRYGCEINDMESAKHVTFDIVNGSKVAVICDSPFTVPDYLSTSADEAQSLIYISNRKYIHESRQYVQLVPKNITIGIGCRKGIDGNIIIKLIKEKLEETGIDERSIKCFASIDIKKNEKGLLDAAAFFAKKINFYSAEDISAVEQRFTVSDFVKEKIGAGNVAESCAYLSSDRSGRLLLQKQKHEGITLAIWEEERNFII